MDETVSERLLPSVDSLRDFRRSHPVETVSAAGETWEFYTGGEGRQLLVLPGASEAAEMWFRHVSALEPDYRVVLVDYPQVDSVEDLIAGVMAVLDTEYVESTDVVGYSLGGCLAQVLAHEYPERFDHLVCANATVPGAVPVRFFRRLAQVTPQFPSWLLVPYARRSDLDAFPGDDEDFWTSYLEDVVDEVSGERGLVTGPRCMVDYAGSYDFDGPSEDWEGSTTIVETEDDLVFDADAREAMRAAYPDASVVTVEGAGHSLPFMAREEFLATVRQAL